MFYYGDEVALAYAEWVEARESDACGWSEECEVAEAVLEAYNRRVLGYGVESIRPQDLPDAAERDWMHDFLSYVNMGDTYRPTLLYDHRDAKFILSSWGDYYEALEAVTDAQKVAILRRFMEENGADDSGRGWFPSQGWAIFDVGDGRCEVQRIDDLADVFRMTDSKARKLAAAMGYRFDDPKSPGRVTGRPREESTDANSD